MHDPANPAGQPADPGPEPGRGGQVSYDSARDSVDQVLAWFTEQILREHRSPAPDADRLEELKARQRACVADQQALEDADPEQISRIAADYDARIKDLNQP